MSIDKLKEEISGVISSKGCSAEFYFLLDGDGGMLLKSIDITEDDHADLEKIFIDSVGDSILLNDDLSLIKLSSADDRKNAIYQYDLEEVPVELTHLKAIIENEDFEIFSFSEDSLSELEGILVLIGNQETQLALYQPFPIWPTCQQFDATGGLFYVFPGAGWP